MSKQTDLLRNRIQTIVQDSDITWHQVALGANVTPQIIYAFRNGGGIAFDNGIKLMNHLGITLEELK